MGQNKIKHTLGLIHSLAWCFFPYISLSLNGDYEDINEIFISFEVDTLDISSFNLLDGYILFSIVYFFQDCFWSIHLKEYAILFHHVAVIVCFVFFYGKDTLKFRMLLFITAMFWSELGAAFIHIKFLKPHSSIAHHLCFVIYFVSRIVFYPIHLVPTCYYFHSTTITYVNELYLGFGLIILVQLFSLFIVITRFHLFVESFIAIFCCTWKLPKGYEKITDKKDN
jgi:hypothetical protein